MMNLNEHKLYIHLRQANINKTHGPVYYLTKTKK